MLFVYSIICLCKDDCIDLIEQPERVRCALQLVVCGLETETWLLLVSLISHVGVYCVVSYSILNANIFKRLSTLLNFYMKNVNRCLRRIGQPSTMVPRTKFLYLTIYYQFRSYILATYYQYLSTYRFFFLLKELLIFRMHNMTKSVDELIGWSTCMHTLLSYLLL